MQRDLGKHIPLGRLDISAPARGHGVVTNVGGESHARHEVPRSLPPSPPPLLSWTTLGSPNTGETLDFHVVGAHK